ncbi:MAG: hypothetical protein Q7U20_07805 [Caulobacter sp.]|nr:hypothetical protein [Caulobacter sp.]
MLFIVTYCAAIVRNGGISAFGHPQGIEEKPMAKKPFTDTLANLIGDVVGDIRDKLVEEAWFGRPISNRAEVAFYDDLWTKRGGAEEVARPSETPEIEFDR